MIAKRRGIVANGIRKLKRYRINKRVSDTEQNR